MNKYIYSLGDFYLSFKIDCQSQKGEIVDPLHDQDHDQSQNNLSFDFKN